MFKQPHEDLEQSFCAEIAIVEKHLKSVKETPRVTRESCKPLNVWKGLGMKSLRLEKCMNVNSMS